MNNLLTRNTDLTFPNFTFLSASAGSGKTTELTLRFLRLILSDKIPANNLPNILAITFTNNSVFELKQRILEYLKKASFGEEKILEQLQKDINLDSQTLALRAKEKVDYILDNYSDFQVQSIDSFLSRILKLSDLEGLPFDYDITLDINVILKRAYELFVQELGYDQQNLEFIGQIIKIINRDRASSDKGFLWNPYKEISTKIEYVYKKLMLHTSPLIIGTLHNIEDIKQQVLNKLCKIGEIVEKSGFKMDKRYEKVIESARKNDFNAVIGQKLDKKILNKPPREDENFKLTQEEIKSLQFKLMQSVADYYVTKAYQHYHPFVAVYFQMLDAIDKVQKQQGKVALNEAIKRLAVNISEMNIPEIYFSLGERIQHFLIDEFQDTSLIQWTTLKPLIEEALSKEGSLFLVGDTKQAIYTFRGGDWQIMARMREDEEFPSVKCDRNELDINYRSSKPIVEFARMVFHEIVPQHVRQEIANLSGLAKYQQHVNDKEKQGFIKVKIFDKQEKTDLPPERQALIEIIKDCRIRGYDLSDIAIITQRNDNVVTISSWLNSEGFPFISYSSLDIRMQKITGEILALLQFLDSPIDNLSFASFLLGNIFKNTSQEPIDIHTFLLNCKKDKTFYTQFRECYPQLWEDCFEYLFNVVGYLPVYDIITEIYRIFDLFNMYPDESATLIKLLEVINAYERGATSAGGNNGNVSLKDFLSSSKEESEDISWNIDVLPNEDAIKIMSIHKAKGLEFPIVIALFYDTRSPSDNMFVVDDDNGVRLMHITQEGTKFSSELLEIYNKKKDLQTVDDLNKLYVALTRAKQEMYVLSVKTNKVKKPSEFLPDNGYIIGKKTSAQKSKQVDCNVADIVYPKTHSIAEANLDKRISLKEIKRGEFIHDVLAKIHYLEETASLDEQIQDAINKNLFKYQVSGQVLSYEFDVNEIQALLKKFLLTQEVASYFVRIKNRIILTEQEICDWTGSLYRVDRLIIDEDMITIIDYKTSSVRGSHVEVSPLLDVTQMLSSAEHATQVKKYIEILVGIYPDRKVKGLIAYI